MVAACGDQTASALASRADASSQEPTSGAFETLQHGRTPRRRPRGGAGRNTEGQVPPRARRRRHGTSSDRRQGPGSVDQDTDRPEERGRDEVERRAAPGQARQPVAIPDAVDLNRSAAPTRCVHSAPASWCVTPFVPKQPVRPPAPRAGAMQHRVAGLPAARVGAASGRELRARGAGCRVRGRGPGGAGRRGWPAGCPRRRASASALRRAGW